MFPKEMLVSYVMRESDFKVFDPIFLCSNQNVYSLRQLVVNVMVNND